MSNDLDPFAYEMPWRPNYEIRAILCWCIALGLSFIVTRFTQMPHGPFFWMSGICAAMVLIRVPGAFKLYSLQKHLSGRPLEFISLEELEKKTESKEDELWLGYGFTWETRHAQRAHEILKRDWSLIQSYMPKREGNGDDMGQPWIHGLEPVENKIYQPLKHTEGHSLIVGTTGSGKAQPLDALVHTPDGWKTMGSLKLGDKVTTPDQGEASILGIYPQGRVPIYQLVFKDGRTVEACGEHLWKRLFDEGIGSSGIYTTTDIKRLIEKTDEDFYIPLIRPIEKPEQPMPFDPYMMGYCLAGGSLDDKRLDNGARAVVWPIRRYLKDFKANHIFQAIPRCYQEGSAEQRNTFLKGAMYAQRLKLYRGSVYLKFMNKQLAQAFQDMAWSLGCVATLSEVQESERKKGRYQLKIKHPLFTHQSKKNFGLRVVEVKCVRSAFAQCIAIDHPDHLYVTNNYVVTHNTRMFDAFISQAILRQEACIIYDPKGDRELRDNAKRACAYLNQPERFAAFHPAFPEQSVRIDPLKNFTRITEIASRLAALIPSEAGADPFKSFGWQALNNIAQGLVMTHERPNLVILRRFLEGGPEGLVVNAVRAHSQRHVAGWEGLIEPYLNKNPNASMRQKAVQAIHFYKDQIQPKAPSSELEGLINMFEHDTTHFSKMVANLLPIMNMLTSGELGKMLSPDPNDMTDDRPIFDTQKIINNGMVAYIGMDSLTDSIVGSAIGSLFLSDLTAVAGDRYNFGVDNRIVNIFVDEAAEVINDPFIQLLNKGRGARIRLFVATQTFADFEARMGDKAKSLQVLGNINNTFALRVTDNETQQYVVDNIPKTRIKSVMRGQGMNTSGEQPIIHGGSQQERLMEEEGDLFAPQLLGMLPNLEYIAKISGGKIVKGRLPILT